MNIIFLDIDGVLNTNDFDTKVSTNNKIYFNELHQGEGVLHINCILNLKKIIDYTHPNTRIVLTSYWRLSDWKVAQFKHYLDKYNINSNIIIGQTINSRLSRENEIKIWLKSNEEYRSINKWIILDDKQLNIENFYKINPSSGLCINDINCILNILSL